MDSKQVASMQEIEKDILEIERAIEQATFIAKESLLDENLSAKILQKIEKQKILIKNGKITISFEGTSNSGKSSLINHIIGKNILPECATSETKAFVLVRHSEKGIDELFSCEMKTFKDPEFTNNDLFFYEKKEKKCEGSEQINKFLKEKNMELRKLNDEEKKVLDNECIFILETKIALFQNDNYSSIRDFIQIIDPAGKDDESDSNNYKEKDQLKKKILNKVNKDRKHINKIKPAFRIQIISIENFSKSGDKQQNAEIMKEINENFKSEELNMNSFFPEEKNLVLINKMDLIQNDSIQLEYYKKNIEKFQNKSTNAFCISLKNYCEYKKKENLFNSTYDVYYVYLKEKNLIDEEDDHFFVEKTWSKQKKIIEEELKNLRIDEYVKNFDFFLEQFKKSSFNYFDLKSKELASLKFILKNSFFEKQTLPENSNILEKIGDKRQFKDFFLKFLSKEMNKILKEFKKTIEYANQIKTEVENDINKCNQSWFFKNLYLENYIKKNNDNFFKEYKKFLDSQAFLFKIFDNNLKTYLTSHIFLIEKNVTKILIVHRFLWEEHLKHVKDKFKEKFIQKEKSFFDNFKMYFNFSYRKVMLDKDYDKFLLTYERFINNLNLWFLELENFQSKISEDLIIGIEKCIKTIYEIISK